MGYFTIALSNGNVAAIITSAEFVVATVTIYCTYPIMRGLWLLQLHRRRRLAVRIEERKYRRIKNELLALIVAVLFAITVALFESNLGQRYIISNEETFSKYCVHMSTASDLYIFSLVNIPRSFKIDQISPEIASYLDCEFGLDTVEFGSEIVSDQYSTSFYVPRCQLKPQQNSTRNGTSISYFPRSEMQSLEITYSSFSQPPIDLLVMDVYEKPFFIVPYNLSRFEKSRPKMLNDSHIKEKINSCEEKKISSIPTVAKKWAIREVDDMFISEVLLERICELQNTDTSATLPYNLLSESISEHFINVSSLREKASKFEMGISEAVIEDVAVLSVADAVWNATAYACTNAVVKIGYSLVSENDLRNITLLGEPLLEDRSTVIITDMEVVSGRCELVQHTIGLFAVVYSARVEWYAETRQFFNQLTRHQTYYAYLMSIARSAFPFEELESPVFKNDQSCPFYIASIGTVVNLDGFFWLAVITFSLALLLIICSLLMFTIFPKQAWHLASFTEKLESISSEFKSSASVTFNKFYNNKKTKILTVDVDEEEAARSPTSDFFVIVDDESEFDDRADLRRTALRSSSYRIETFAQQDMPYL